MGSHLTVASPGLELPEITNVQAQDLGGVVQIVVNDEVQLLIASGGHDPEVGRDYLNEVTLSCDPDGPFGALLKSDAQQIQQWSSKVFAFLDRAAIKVLGDVVDLGEAETEAPGVVAEWCDPACGCSAADITPGEDDAEPA